jgi:RNA polymerase sigma factor (sigma-70 family)
VNGTGQNCERGSRIVVLPAEIDIILQKAGSEWTDGEYDRLAGFLTTDPVRNFLIAVAAKTCINHADQVEAVARFYVKIDVLRQKWNPSRVERDRSRTLLKFVSTIVRYQALDILDDRTRRREESLTVFEGDEEYERQLPSLPEMDPVYLVEKQADQDAYHAALKHCLPALPKQQQLAVTMHLINEMDYPAIAAHLQFSQGTVRQWVHRGRKKLAECLASILPRLGVENAVLFRGA